MAKKENFFQQWHEFWYKWHIVKSYYYGSRRHEKASEKHLKKMKKWQDTLPSTNKYDSNDNITENSEIEDPTVEPLSVGESN